MGVLSRTGFDSGVGPPEDPGFFAGVRSDGRLLAQTITRKPSPEWVMLPGYLIDIPLSLVVDVLCIPSDFRKKMDLRKADGESPTDAKQP